MFKLQKLNNGLTMITCPMTGTKTATIQLVVCTGSKYETRKNNGISHFLEHMFFKGTENRPTALAISSELDGVGGEYNAFTSKEYTGYWVKVDASKIELAMDIVSDMIMNPKLASEEIEREKGVIIEELNMYMDNPMIYIEDLFEECLYGDTPAGWDTIGTRKNIAGFKREDFMSYFKSQYGSQNSFLCLAGNIGDKTIRSAEKFFNRLKASKAAGKPAVKEQQPKPALLLHYKKTDQCHLSLGVRTFPYGHADMFVAQFIAVLLGSSMSSRLFIQLRERRGLAYYVRANSEFYSDSGYLTAQAGVPVDKIDESIKVILDEYKKLKIEPVNTQELKKVKDMIRGRSTLLLESSDNVATWYAQQAVMLSTSKASNDGKQKPRTPEQFFKLIDSITAADIKRVARKIFTSDRLNLAMIGPYREKVRFEKIVKI